jgi:hypothetical protein
MSDLEKAARQALDALEDCVSGDLTVTAASKSIEALRAALAQQQTEPFAYCYVRKGTSADALTFDANPADAVSDTVFPLFAAPQQAKPVSVLPKSFRAGYMAGYDDGLRSALEQAEPVVEPEHWVVTTKIGDIVGFRAPGLKKGDKVYPHPQQQAEPVADSGNASY